MLAPWIISHFPAHRCYTEVFGGGASVLLRKPPSEVEVYNDLNGELVSLFRVLRDKDAAAELARLLALTPWAYDEWDASYTRDADEIENARRLVVCNHMSVGTAAICRGGRDGFRRYSRTDKLGAVPVKQWATLPEAIAQIVDRIQGRVIIENGDAHAVMKQHDSPTTLHYVDPPYPKHTRGDSGDRYAHEMTDTDHRKLAVTLRHLTGMVVLSGYASALYDDDLFAGWTRVARQTHADGARKRTEVLWLNPAASRATHQLNLGGAA